MDVESSTVANTITTTEAKNHLRVDGSDEDSLIDRLILAAINSIESKARISMIPQTIRLRVPKFPTRCGYFALPGSPVRSITSIEYLDEDGDLVTVSDTLYSADFGARPCKVFLANSTAQWPEVANSRPDAVQIVYDAGPAATSGVADELVAAALLMIGHLYENRESVAVGTIASVLPEAVNALIMKHQIPNGELGVVDA